jgi:hypothetical protein
MIEKDKETTMKDTKKTTTATTKTTTGKYHKAYGPSGDLVTVYIPTKEEAAESAGEVE